MLFPEDKSNWPEDKGNWPNTKTSQIYKSKFNMGGEYGWVVSTSIFPLKLSWAVKVASLLDTACYVCRKELVDWTGSLR